MRIYLHTLSLSLSLSLFLSRTHTNTRTHKSKQYHTNISVCLNTLNIEKATEDKKFTLLVFVYTKTKAHAKYV